ncbi:amidohydrolase family protein [uncultured Oscillibacter sp.]|uniref:metal-dependent hydrolase family protein n=1 Tax=uncultured Oscillibacter sp. TaxID=876091 RepID=UPI0026399689|nr:amidohydrolase family protein [uncultured Oscillibacter sp.]
MELIFRNGAVWQKDGFVRKDIRVSGKTIALVEDCLPPSPGIQEYDLNGRFLLPGIIDCHWHLGMAADDPQTRAYYNAAPMEGAYMCAGYAKRMLYAGFTTVRECGAMYGETAALRDSIRKGQLEGPRLLVCGSAISIPGGHMPSAVHISGPEEARRAAREQLAQGADFLKVMLTGGLGRTNEIPDTVEIDLDELQAICREGHRVGKQIACHAHSKKAMMNAAEAGASTIEHATMLDQELVEKLLEKHIAIVPTFSPYGLVAQIGEQYQIPPEVRQSAQRLFELKCERFHLARRQGVTILYGRDVFLIEPEDIAGEMIFMQQAGMSAAEVIRSATDIAAGFLGIGSETGSIQPGRDADLIILTQNPLEDLRRFNTSLTGVMKSGVWVRTE